MMRVGSSCGVAMSNPLPGPQLKSGTPVEDVLVEFEGRIMRCEDIPDLLVRAQVLRSLSRIRDEN
jgi:hypothetical protein